MEHEFGSSSTIHEGFTEINITVQGKKESDINSNENNRYIHISRFERLINATQRN